MRTKLILWGKTEKEEKVLVAIELVENENMVKTYLIKEQDATEEFYNLLLNEWRFDKDIEFPKDYETFEKPLTASEDILPEGILVEKPDLISRAKTEWHFVVLSKKLYDLYKEELDDLKEKVSGLSEFSSEYWDELKQFWSKVQTHIREKNLFRNHVDSLKRRTDELFNQLKQFRKKADAELRVVSQKSFDEFNEVLDKVEEKIEKGFGLQPIFEELKDIQNKFKNIQFDRDHRRKLWNRIDKSFKIVKEKRFGNTSNDRSPLSRLERRQQGLKGAIERMTSSIDRDKRDLGMQNNKIDESDGQLEAELRKARLFMIEDRISSKAEKLQDMFKTKEMLEERMVIETKKEAERKKYEEAKKEAKEKIKEKVKESSDVLKENEEELKKASEKIKKESSLGIVDKSETIMDKTEDKVETFADKAEDVIEDMVDKAEDIVEDVVDKAKDVIEDVVDKAEDIAESIMDNIKDTIKEVKDKLDGEEEE